MAVPDDELRSLLRELVLQSPEHAVLLLDIDGRPRWGNDAACRLLGVGADTLATSDLADFFVPQERALGVPENELRIARADSPAEDDRWQQRADGSRFWASGVLLPLRGADGTLLGFGKIFRNRTDMRQQVDTIRHQLGAARADAEARSRSLARVAHELRNPLSPIGFGCEALRSRALDAESTAMLDMIERQVSLLTRLVDDLVDASVADAGGLQLARLEVPINRVLRDALATVRPAIEARGHQIDVLLVGDALRVHADPDRLQQVFVNLLQNAAKFTPPGGRIWLKATTEGNECVVRVEDNGVGLAADEIGRIFDMFSRAGAGPDARGLGVGLSVVKAIVEGHGGTVQVESDGPGNGAKFAVRLPAALPDTPP